MRIILATGLTKNFIPRGARFYDSIREHCNVTPTLFCVDMVPPLPAELSGIPSICVPYVKVSQQLPKWMLQTGCFTEFAPSCWDDTDAIIFADGDAYLQRPFDDLELDLFRSCRLGDILLGPNMPHRETLREEAPRLSPRESLQTIEQHFHRMGEALCYNTGFVVATLRTWMLLRSEVAQWIPTCYQCFSNAAWVQFIICYVAQLGHRYRIRDLPLSVHAHGHCGIHPGVEKRGEQWFYHGKLIAYAHAL